MKPITGLKKLFSNNLVDFYQVGEDTLVVTNVFTDDDIIFTIGTNKITSMYMNSETGKMELLSEGIGIVLMFIQKNIGVIKNAEESSENSINEILTSLNIKRNEN